MWAWFVPWTLTSSANSVHIDGDSTPSCPFPSWPLLKLREDEEVPLRGLPRPAEAGHVLAGSRRQEGAPGNHNQTQSACRGL